MTAGSSIWQIAFLSFALFLLAFEMARGWRLGLVRQLFRLLALLLAYGAGLWGGRLLLPILRPFLRAPDFVISLVAGALLGLIVYVVINGVNSVLFQRTAQQKAGARRLIYGTGGAVLGIFFGLFTVWLVVVAIRTTGTIANAEFRRPKQATIGPAGLPARHLPNDQPPMIRSLARLQNSIELGPVGQAVKNVDVVPSQTYQTLGKVGALVSNPASAERFLSYPGAKSLNENPRIVALRDDPEIRELIEQGRYLELLQHPKLIEALNDPALAAEVKRFEFTRALDYALQKN